MTSKAYITQEGPNFNYAPAEEFGDLKFVTCYDYNNSGPASHHNAALTTSIRAGLRDFDPDVDYIVPSGSPVVTGVVMMILREKTNKLNILKWSNIDRRYYPLTVEV